MLEKIIGNIVLTIVVTITLFIGYCFIIVDIPDMEPDAYSPPPTPIMDGILAPNTYLQSMVLLGKGKLPEPEDVAVDVNGSVYAATSDGYVKRIGPNGQVENFAFTGGRPLGMKFAPSGDLIVVGPNLQIAAIEPDGTVNVLVGESFEISLGLPDDLDIDSKGFVYFSDATSPELGGDFYFDLIMGKPFGKLIKYDVATSSWEILLDDLYFANGVALSPSEDFVLVCETARFRITRLFLSGTRAGERDIFAENLPGYPDGIMGDGSGNYWVALASPRKPLIDRLVSPRVWLKKFLMRLPNWARPSATRYGLVIKLDKDGNIVHSLHDPTGKKMYGITNVMEYNDKLYMGTLYGDAVGVYDLKK